MTGPADDDAPYHAHIYVDDGQADAAKTLHLQLRDHPAVLFVGRITQGKAGPHPIPQFEVHFLAKSLDEVVGAIEASELRALVHPLTDDDLADHTSLARWIGGPLDLDLGTLDPPGKNQGVPRFGKTDF